MNLPLSLGQALGLQLALALVLPPEQVPELYEALACARAALAPQVLELVSELPTPLLQAFLRGHGNLTRKTDTSRGGKGDQG